MFLLVLLAFSQSGRAVNRDSLFQAYDKAGADTQQVNTLNDFGRKYISSDPSQALSWFQKAIEIGTQLDFSTGTGRAWLYICQSKTATGDYDEALEACDRARVLFEQARNVSYTGKAWNSTGIIHYYRGELEEAGNAYLKALEYFSDSFYIATLHNNLANVRKLAGDEVDFVKYQLKALDGFTQLKDESMMLYCLGNLSVFYIQRGDLEKAKDYNSRSYAILGDKDNKQERVFLHAQKADILTQSGDSSGGMELYREVRALALELGYLREEASALSNMAGIYFGQGSYELARERLQEAGHIFKDVEDLRGQSVTEASLARILLATGKHEEGMQKLQNAVAFALEFGDPSVLAPIYDQMAKAYAAAGDAENALLYREKHMETEEGLRDPVKWRKVVEMEGAFQSKAREARMAQLEEEQKASDWVNRMLILGLTLAVVVLIGLLIYFRRRPRQEKQTSPNGLSQTLEVILEQAETRGRIQELRKLLEEKEETIQRLQTQEPDARPPQVLPPYFETLSAREIEVFLCLGEGMTDKEIAEDLSISLPTIRTHARNVYGKLNLKNRREAVKMAHQYNLLQRR